MLDKADFASWQQRIRLYCRGKDNGVNILKSIDEGHFQMGTTRGIVAEGTEGSLNLGPERPRVYSDLSQDEKDRYNADIRATNIILQGLPKDIYSLINHYTDAMDLCGPMRVQTINGKDTILASSMIFSFTDSSAPTNGSTELSTKLCRTTMQKKEFLSKDFPRTPQQNRRCRKKEHTLVELQRQCNFFPRLRFSLGRSCGYLLLLPKPLDPLPAPAIPYVPPTNKELEMLFQPMFDEYFNLLGIRQNPIPNAAQDPVIPTGPSVSIAINLDAPSGSHTSSPLDHHSSSVHHGVAGEQYAEVNPFAAADPEPFVNVFRFGPNITLKPFTPREITIPESNQSTQPHEHIRKWTDSHPLDNIIGNPSRPVSTQKQLATDALWCFYKSVLSKAVEPRKTFQSASY
ncbi:hypothetical protein Tco_0671582 [Tanacetum coccineum]